MNSGWIKLHRKIIDWGWYRSPKHVAVFLDLLLHANYEDGHYMGVPIKTGSLTTSYGKISERTGVSLQSVRTILRGLNSTGDITIKTSNKFTMISITNWHLYQGDNTATNNQLTINQQSTNNQLTTSKKLRNKEEEEEEEKTASVVVGMDSMIQSWNDAAIKGGMKPCPLALGGNVLSLAKVVGGVLTQNNLSWSDYFSKIAESDFLKVKKGGPITLMWALDEKNFNKIMAGNFDQKEDPLKKFMDEMGIEGVKEI